jgi:hypothetical protein
LIECSTSYRSRGNARAGGEFTSTLIPSLAGFSFAGVPSSPVATFETSLFLGGMFRGVNRNWHWESGNRKEIAGGLANLEGGVAWSASMTEHVSLGLTSQVKFIIVDIN